MAEKPQLPSNMPDMITSLPGNTITSALGGETEVANKSLFGRGFPSIAPMFHGGQEPTREGDPLLQVRDWKLYS